MKAGDVWMPIIIGDYLGDTLHLTTEQHGAYFLLMMHQWRRGIIPETTGEMAQISRCTATHFKRHIAPAIAQFFTRVEGGFIVKRLAEEREKAEHRSRVSAENVAKRWEKTKQNNEADTIENNELEDTSVIQNGYSSPSPIEESKKEAHSATPHVSAQTALMLGPVKVSETKSPADIKTVLWSEGLSIVRRTIGKGDRSSRMLLGKWCAAMKDDAAQLMVILRTCEIDQPGDPSSWITKAVGNRSSPDYRNGGMALLRDHRDAAMNEAREEARREMIA